MLSTYGSKARKIAMTLPACRWMPRADAGKLATRGSKLPEDVRKLATRGSKLPAA